MGDMSQDGPFSDVASGLRVLSVRIGKSDEEPRTFDFPVARTTRSTVSYACSETAALGVEVTLSFEGDDPMRIRIDWQAPPGVTVVEVCLPDALRAERHHQLLVPHRMGQILRPEQTRPARRRLQTGRGYSMSMVAVVGAEESYLAHWEHPGWAIIVDGTDGATIQVSFVAQESGLTLNLERVASGDLSVVAARHRELLDRLSFVKTWQEKVAEDPSRRRLEGAAEFRPLCFSRFVPGCWFNEGSVDQLHLEYTFPDVAAVARHWHDALGIDRALVMLCGWMRRGYDNQHPDVFPAASECGGDLALREAGNEIREVGFLFGLHDNYHDMYPDSPSWNPDLLRRTARGDVVWGGKWAGGQAALLCAETGVQLLERNLPEIEGRYAPDALYIDVIYAHPLEPCSHPDHPMGRQEDLNARRRQARLAKRIVPVFGSEEGQQWGASDAEYFEGLLSHYVEEGPESVFPWFEWVLRDCVQLIPHAWDQATPDRTDYIIRCLSLGHMPIYAVPNRRYFEQPEAEWKLSVLHRHYAPPHMRRDDLSFPAGAEERAPLARADQGWAEGLNVVDRFIKNTYEVLSPISRSLVDRRMTAFRRLGPTGRLVETEFGPGCRIVVSEEPEPIWHAGALLPPFGFMARTPAFLALHASQWSGVAYERPALFTVASLDGEPLETCRRARIFHGFGDPALFWRERLWRVQREAIVDL